MRTWKSKYSELRLAAEIRYRRIEQAQARMVAMLNGDYRIVATVAGDWATAKRNVYQFSDGSILIADLDNGYRVADGHWFDSLEEATALYAVMASVASVAMFRALCGLATVQRPKHMTQRERELVEMVQKWQALCAA